MGEARIEQWTKSRLDHWLTSSWASSLSGVVSAMSAGSALSFEPHDPSPVAWAKWADPLWVEVQCGIAEAAMLRVGCARATAAALGSMFCDAEIEDEAVAETLCELVNQTVAGVALAVRAQNGEDLEYGAASSAPAPMLTDLGIELRFEIDGATHLLAFVPNSEALEAVLDPALAGPVGSVSSGGDAEPRFESSRRPTPSDENGVQLSESAQKNLRMLLDVDLDLAVSFGSTDLPLQDVLKLASGSIVELNRNASDPVDVLVNDRVIARGEVVVVDGNYGIRITEIVSRLERIRTVF